MPEQPLDDPLSAEELEVWTAFATLLERLPSALDAQLQRDSELTHFEHGILFALDTAPEGSLRLSVLAGYAHCTLSRLSRAISRLEAKAWVKREIDPSDGRFTLGVLTPSGHDKVAASTPAHHALVKQLVLDNLTPGQTRQLRTISEKISAAIDPSERWQPPGVANP